MSVESKNRNILKALLIVGGILLTLFVFCICAFGTLIYIALLPNPQISPNPCNGNFETNITKDVNGGLYGRHSIFTTDGSDFYLKANGTFYPDSLFDSGRIFLVGQKSELPNFVVGEGITNYKHKYVFGRDDQFRKISLVKGDYWMTLDGGSDVTVVTCKKDSFRFE